VIEPAFRLILTGAARPPLGWANTFTLNEWASGFTLSDWAGGFGLMGTPPGLTALVGDRVYFGLAPQNERRPRIVLSLVSSISAHTFTGLAGYAKGRVQVDCLAPTYADAKALADAAQDALDNYVGTVDGTAIDWIETEEARDVPTAPPVGTARPTTYGVSFDAKFMCKE
jgi:hypothetical protein